MVTTKGLGIFGDKITEPNTKIIKEVMTAVTINGAYGVRRGDSVGSLEVGKLADIVIWDAPNIEFLKGMFAGIITGVVSGLIALNIPALQAIVGGGVLLSCPLTIIAGCIVGALTKDEVTGRKADEIAVND